MGKGTIMHPTRRTIRARAQRGVVAVEFGMLALVFFSLVFGTLEIARAMYLWSMMIESTQRAARGAAQARFDSATQEQVRNAAMFGQTGGVFMAGNLRPANLRIDYLNNGLDPVNPPACPYQQIVNCSANVNAANCIRFVRVRLCTSGDGAGGCTRVDYIPLFGGSFFPSGLLQFPTFATITPAGLLGHQPGGAACP